MRRKFKIASALCLVFRAFALFINNTATSVKKAHRIISPVRLLTACAALICTIGIQVIPEAYAAGECQVMLTVKQVLSGAGLSSSVNQTFTYRLIPKTTGAPMPENSSLDGYTFTITGNVDAQAGPLIFSSAGTSVYEISCVANGNTNVTYDRQIYTIEVYVTNDMTSSVVVYNSDGSKVTGVVFEHVLNLLPSDPSAMINPQVVKTVSGNPPTASTFTFRLVAKDLSNPMPEGSSNGVKTVSVTGSGQAVFGTWSYTAEGTYYYTVSEVNSGAGNYVYDGAIYTITDTVSAEDGQLLLTRVITNSSNKQVMSYPFINTYKTGGGGGGNTPTPTPTPTPSKPPVKPVKPSEPGGPVQPPEGPDDSNDGDLIHDKDPPLGTIPGGNPGSGPKTGDESRIILNIVLFGIAGVAALGSTVYLLTGKRCEKKTRR